jgi:uncharacterized protein (DUF924 family)
MPGHGEQAADVLEFWFGQSRPRQWFAKDPAFDALLRERFLGLTRQALAGELNAWGTGAAGGLALVLLLDQFPRHPHCQQSCPLGLTRPPGGPTDDHATAL